MTDYKKLYEEALERAKYWAEGKCMNDFYDSPQNVLNFVFPETKESEGERIRKFLIKCVQQPMGTNLLNGLKKDDVIAWLEKQDEQKPADKVEPKFKVGDKINMINREEEDYTILTITSINMDEKCYICNQGSVIDFDEEREWYKIEPKPTWSEDDEKMLVLCASSVRTRHNDGLLTTEEYERASLWLKSLKERIQSQPKQELNEETVNEYINLGLPSGTLWKSANEEGYYTFDNAVEKFGDLLPTKEQWEELRDYCIWVWSNNGYVVTGPNNNTIFLPADGTHLETGVYYVGTDGHYWSCTNDKESYAWDMYFDRDRDDFNVYLGLRYYGRSVRLVK